MANQKGLKLPCPVCDAQMSIRTSSRPTLLTVQAECFCPVCNQIRASFVGQIMNVRRAVFIDCPEANTWDKPEKELLKEKGVKPLTNEQRIQLLKGETLDFDLEPSS